MKKRDRKILFLSLAVLILLGIALIFYFIFSTWFINPLLSPQYTINSFLDSLPTGISNIVIGNNANPEEAAAASEFSGKFGPLGEAILESQISSQQNIVVIGAASSFTAMAYTDKIQGYEAIIIYDPYLNSLFIYGSSGNNVYNAVQLIKDYQSSPSDFQYTAIGITGLEQAAYGSQVTITPLACSDNTLYEACSQTQPNYCKIGEIIPACQICGCQIGAPGNWCRADGVCELEGTASAIRAINFNSADKTGTVTIHITLQGASITNLIIAEIVPQGFVISNIAPPAVINTENTLAWLYSQPPSNSFDITYYITQTSSTPETIFSGKIGATINNLDLENPTTGDATIQPGIICTNQCSSLGQITCSGNILKECVTGANECLILQDKQTCQLGCDVDKCIPFTCSDTDSGLDIFAFGTVTYTDASGATAYFDTCGSGTITEYSCGSSGVVETSLPCYNCNLGICLQQYSCQNTETKTQLCPDGTSVQCTCTNNQWNCPTCPVTNLAGTLSNIISSQNSEGFVLVIGADAQAPDSVGAVDTAGKLKIASTLIDNNPALTNKTNKIIIGGPCVNKEAAEFLGLPYPSCGESALGIPVNQAIIQIKNTQTGTEILIAGWEAVHTRNAALAILRSTDFSEFNGKNFVVTGSTLGQYILTLA